MTIYLSLPGWFQLSPVFINITSLLSLCRMSWYIEINHDPSRTVQHNSLCAGTSICHRVCSFWCEVCLIRAVNFVLKELNPPQTLTPIAVIHTHKHTSRHAHCTLYNSTAQALETSTWPEQDLNSQSSFLSWRLILEVNQDGPLSYSSPLDFVHVHMPGS